MGRERLGAGRSLGHGRCSNGVVTGERPRPVAQRSVTCSPRSLPSCAPGRHRAGSSPPLQPRPAWTTSRWRPGTRPATRRPRLRRCAALPGGSAAADLAALWRVSELTGCSLVVPVTRLLAGHRADDRLHRQVDAALAGPRSTARLLAVLPVAGMRPRADPGGRPDWLPRRDTGRAGLPGRRDAAGGPRRGLEPRNRPVGVAVTGVEQLAVLLAAASRAAADRARQRGLGQVARGRAATGVGRRAAGHAPKAGRRLSASARRRPTRRVAPARRVASTRQAPRHPTGCPACAASAPGSPP